MTPHTLTALLLALALSSSAWGAESITKWEEPVSLAPSVAAVPSTGWIVQGELTGSESISNPGVDVFRVTCPTPATTQIRSRVRVFGPSTPNAHVTTLCVSPASRLGKGDTEIAQWPEKPNSDGAEAPGCTKALIGVTCDFSQPCVNTGYWLFVSCVGATTYGVITHTINH